MTGRLTLALILTGWIALCGCSRGHYRRSADREAAAIISAKSAVVPNMESHFTIDPAPRLSLEDLPVKEAAEEMFGPGGDFEVGARRLPLGRALEMATLNSRTYQNEKESLYLQALSLALVRHRYTPIYSIDGAATYAETVAEVEAGINTVVRERTLRGGAGVRADYLLRTGGRLAVDFTTDFLRFVTGDPRVTSSSALVATFTQPLMRGGGKVAAEPITQAERSMLYALRQFVRFRQGFTLDVVDRYYRVLQSRDSLGNSYRALVGFKQNEERARAYVEADRMLRREFDEIRQAVLTGEIGWINGVRQYQQRLDEFKIAIGLPLETPVYLDPAELGALEINHPEIEEAEAVRVALASRLDLYNQRDQLEDAVRQVSVAANGLLPQLDLVASAGTGGTRTGEGFPEIDWSQYRWNAGLNLDLPIDRKAERNGYRAALINQDRSARALELAIDDIRLQIREDWQGLDQARRTFDISVTGVELADRRVLEQNIRLDIGEGTATDLVNAQNAQLDSQNTRTGALVTHTLARLRLFRDMGVLTINDDGSWNEESSRLSSN